MRLFLLLTVFLLNSCQETNLKQEATSIDNSSLQKRTIASRTSTPIEEAESLSLEWETDTLYFRSEENKTVSKIVKLKNNNTKSISGLSFKKILGEKSFSISHNNCERIPAKKDCSFKISFKPNNEQRFYESIIVVKNDYKKRLNIFGDGDYSTEEDTTVEEEAVDESSLEEDYSKYEEIEDEVFVDNQPEETIPEEVVDNEPNFLPDFNIEEEIEETINRSIASTDQPTSTSIIVVQNPTETTSEDTQDNTSSSGGSSPSVPLAPPVNNSPTGENQTIIVLENTPKNIFLTGTDTEGVSLSFEITSEPNKGTTNIDNIPNIVYTPNLDELGNDSIKYRVFDGNSYSEEYTITITIENVNDMPSSENQTIITKEDTPISFDLIASDKDGDTVEIIIDSSTNNGDLDTSNLPNIKYSPKKDFFGNDTFTYRVTDGELISQSYTVSITVTEDNTVPQISDLNFSMMEDEIKKFILPATDDEGDLITFEIKKSDSNASYNLVGNEIEITPNENFNGILNYSYTVTDGRLVSEEQNITINVSPVNDAPTQEDWAILTKKQLPVTTNLIAVDIDSKVLTYSIIESPKFGVLDSSTLPEITYTPNIGYVGLDSLIYKVTDGDLETVVNVSITVEDRNLAPVAYEETYNIKNNETKSISLKGFDPEGSVLSYEIISSSPSLILDVSNIPNISVQPNRSFVGSSNLVYRVFDGELYSEPQTVYFTVSEGNFEPILSETDEITTIEDEPISFSIEATDVDSSLTYEVKVDPSNGILTGTLPNLTYTPNSNFVGKDTLTYSVFDGEFTKVKVLTINVTPINDAPTAEDLILSTLEDTDLAFVLPIIDIDSSNLLTTVSNPTNGVIVKVDEKNYVYKPNLNYTGTDNFSYTVSDGELNNTYNIQIIVTPVNDAPVANDETFTTPEEILLSESLSAQDIDSSSLTYNVVQSTNNGTLNLNSDGSFTYLPNNDWIGVDLFTYTVSDGLLNSTTKTVSITVTNVNDAPENNPLNFTVAEDSILPMDLSSFDKDGDALTYTIKTNPSHGVLSGSLPNVSYTPNPNFNGNDTFVYTVNDGTVVVERSVSITVTPINDKPTGSDLSLSTPEDTDLPLVLPMNDIDGDSLSVEMNTSSLNGAVVNSSYIPSENFTGITSFQYRVTDGNLFSDWYTVSINVTPVDDAPSVEDINITMMEDSTEIIFLSASDIDTNTLIYTLTKPINNGSITNENLPSFEFTPVLNFTGNTTIEFTVSDGNTTISRNVNITVVPVNDKPTATLGDLSTNEDEGISFILTCEDIDSNSFTFNIESNPNNGVLSEVSSPMYSYTPNSNFAGVDSFQYTCSDGGLTSDIKTVNITVLDINDAPFSQDFSFIVYEGGTLNETLIASDPEGDSLTFNVSSSSSGSLSLNSDGTFSYIADVANLTNDSFSFTVSDGNSVSTIHTVNITIIKDTGTGLIGSYYEGMNFDKKIFSRLDKVIDFSYGNNAPNEELTRDTFSIRWEGQIYIPKDGDYTFITKSDDGVRLWVDGTQIINNWTNHSVVEDSGTVSLTQGKVDIKLEYFENSGSSTINLFWSSNSFSREVIPMRKLYPNQDLERSHAIELTINNTYIQEDLIGFPIMIDLSLISDQDFWNNVQGNGEDIVITFEENGVERHAPLELIAFDAINKEGTLWSKVNIKKDQSNKVKIKVGSSETLSLPQKGDAFGAQEVWSNNYVGVWHLNNMGQLKDSTVNENFLSTIGTVNESTSISALNNSADLINSYGGFVSNTNSDIQNLTATTFEAWINPKSKSSDTIVISKDYALDLQMSWGYPKLSIQGSSQEELWASRSLSNNRWYHIAGSYNNSSKTGSLYIDGNQDVSGNWFSNNIPQNINPITIGALEGSSSQNFQGFIDEVRISSVERSEAWISSQYNMVANQAAWWLLGGVTVEMSENFSRSDSETVGNGWTEVEQDSDYAVIEDNALRLESNNETSSPILYKSFNEISTGHLEINYSFTADRGPEKYFGIYFQAGKGLEDDVSDNKEAVNLIWGSPSFGLDNQAGFGYVNGNTVTEMTTFNDTLKNINILIDLDNRTYTVTIDGISYENIAFDNNVNSIDSLRIYLSEVHSGNVEDIYFENIEIIHHQ